MSCRVTVTHDCEEKLEMRQVLFCNFLFKPVIYLDILDDRQRERSRTFVTSSTQRHSNEVRTRPYHQLPNRGFSGSPQHVAQYSKIT